MLILNDKNERIGAVKMQSNYNYIFSTFDKTKGFKISALSLHDAAEKACLKLGNGHTYLLFTI